VDLKARKIVSNESSDIVRMLNTAKLGKEEEEDVECINLYNKELASEIDETNAWVYELLNNGVYRCGFSTQQSAYDTASAGVIKGLDRANDVLAENDYLCGSTFTEADLRLLPTILRFDGAYAPLFRAGGVNRRIRDYPHLLLWLQRCWEIEGVKESIDLEDAVSSYYKQLFPLNPGGLLPTPITKEEIGLS
jgi:putative glutathione S-transferase